MMHMQKLHFLFICITHAESWCRYIKSHDFFFKNQPYGTKLVKNVYCIVFQFAHFLKIISFMAVTNQVELFDLWLCECVTKKGLH